MIWVDLDEVPIGVSLGFESEWEAPVAFRWTLVSVDEHGQEMARVDVPFQERGRSSEGRVVNLMGAARRLLAIGVNPAWPWGLIWGTRSIRTWIRSRRSRARLTSRACDDDGVRGPRRQSSRLRRPRQASAGAA